MRRDPSTNMGPMWYRLLPAAAVGLDAATTMLGLRLGLGEAGPVASLLLPALGPLYFLFELAAVYGLYALVSRLTLLTERWAAVAASLGAWVAGWANLGLIAGVLLGG